MANDSVGSIRKVTFDGVTYNAAADADFKQLRGQWETDSVPTSGVNMMQMKKRAENLDGVDLITSDTEYDALKSLSERGVDFPMSYVTASGAVYRATGRINLGERQTMEGKTSVKMLPRGAWEAFLA